MARISSMKFDYYIKTFYRKVRQAMVKTRKAVQQEQTKLKEQADNPKSNN